MLKGIYIVLVICFWSGCTKEVAGPKGEQGTAGMNGNLIKTQTNTIKKDSTDWKINGSVWESTIFIPELNNTDIFNNSEVKVYLNLESAWWSLPRVNNDYFIKYAIDNGFVKLNAYKFHGPPGPRPATAYYRVVVLYPVQ